MPSDTDLSLDNMAGRLRALEAQCSHSNLVIYGPTEEQSLFFEALCQLYLQVSRRERQRIRNAVANKQGVLNCLLGYVYRSAEQVRATGDVRWLRIGLAAAAIQQDGYDYRDFLLALADLYVTAEEAGIDPIPAFEAIGGGIPADFGRYAVVKSRRRRPDNTNSLSHPCPEH